VHPTNPPQRSRRPGRAGIAIAAASVAGIAGIAYAAISLSSPVSGADGSTGGAVAVATVPTGRPAHLGAPRDELSLAEWGYATHLAETTLPTDATDVLGEPSAEFISANIPTNDVDATSRVVDVVFYDYTADQQHQVTVDLSAGTVLDSIASTNIQPPTTPTEADVAMDLLLASPLRAAVARGFEDDGAGQLTRKDQVSYAGGSYKPTPGVQGAEDCGAHRCVELQIQSPSGRYLTTSGFVVDLSARTVIATK
jgi:hypothetical protein